MELYSQFESSNRFDDLSFDAPLPFGAFPSFVADDSGMQLGGFDVGAPAIDDHSLETFLKMHLSAFVPARPASTLPVVLPAQSQPQPETRTKRVIKRPVAQDFVFDHGDEEDYEQAFLQHQTRSAATAALTSVLRKERSSEACSYLNCMLPLSFPSQSLTEAMASMPDSVHLPADTSRRLQEAAARASKGTLDAESERRFTLIADAASQLSRLPTFHITDTSRAERVLRFRLRRVIDRCTPRAEAASRSRYARQRVRIGGRFVPRAVMEAAQAQATSPEHALQIAAEMMRVDSKTVYLPPQPSSEALAHMQLSIAAKAGQMQRSVPQTSRPVAGLDAKSRVIKRKVSAQ